MAQKSIALPFGGAKFVTSKILILEASLSLWGINSMPTYIDNNPNKLIPSRGCFFRSVLKLPAQFADRIKWPLPFWKVRSRG